VAITLDPFGWGELERRVAAGEGGAEELLSRACARVRPRLGTDEPALRVPRLALGRPGHTRRFALELRRGDLLALKREADRQDVELRDLLAHVLMLELAGEPGWKPGGADRGA